MTAYEEAASLIKAMSDAATRTSDVVDRYYTLCIPFYREFLGRHWHTGFYSRVGAMGPEDQLRMERVVADSAQVSSGSRVLDVGCGIGGTACYLARHTGACFVGVTPNATQLQLAQAHANAEHLDDRVAFVRGSSDALPFADGSFDSVLFFESACHFADRAVFFSEVHRVLKPGGRVAGEDWLAASGLASADWQRWIDPLCAAWAIPALGTLESYSDTLHGAGLRVDTSVDMRDEMAIERGFIVNTRDRREVEGEIAASRDPIRRLIMHALLLLGDAVRARAFTVGRFVAVKPL